MAPTGWNTGEQIRNHKLATSIINGHGDEDNAVFDDASLATLQRFCMDPTILTRDQMMQDEGWVDEAGQEPGTKAAGKGSLVGYLVGRHGTSDPAFDERDFEMLREWFAKGMPSGEKVVR